MKWRRIARIKAAFHHNLKRLLALDNARLLASARRCFNDDFAVDLFRSA